MRVLVCPQEFKGSLTAVEAAAALALGVRDALPDAEIDTCPLADGGPGTVDAVVGAVGGRYTDTMVEGPLGGPVRARWARIPPATRRTAAPSDADGHTAVIEMAAASGLVLVPPARRDPLRASTVGTGQLIAAALDAGVRRVLLGVGGSATNDGGAGAVCALGARLLDDDDRDLPPGGAALARLARIDVRALDARLRDTELAVLADVTNPLLGPEGATAVYGPQKGADPAQIAELERALTNFADIIRRDLDVDVTRLPGGGAAGGLAAGLVAFAGARIERGFDVVAEVVGLDARAAAADFLLTGEGRLDAQSAYGKTVSGVAAAARRAGRPCLAVAGAVAPGAADAIPGLTDAEPLLLAGGDEADAMTRAAQLARGAAARLVGRQRRRR